MENVQVPYVTAAELLVFENYVAAGWPLTLPDLLDSFTEEQLKRLLFYFYLNAKGQTIFGEIAEREETRAGIPAPARQTNDVGKIRGKRRAVRYPQNAKRLVG